MHTLYSYTTSYSASAAAASSSSTIWFPFFNNRFCIIRVAFATTKKGNRDIDHEKK